MIGRYGIPSEDGDSEGTCAVSGQVPWSCL